MNLVRNLIRFLFLFLLSTSSRAADDGYQVSAQVIGVSKISAMMLLNDPRFISDPTAMLQHLNALIARHEAEAIITQTIPRTALPGRASIEKAKTWRTEFDSSAPENGVLFMNVSVEHVNEGRSTMLMTNPAPKLGIPKFLGTMQLPDSDSTWLVFLTVQ